MNSLEPLRIQQINLNNIRYTKIKHKKNENKKIIYIKYDNKPFVFQCGPLLNENLPIKITNDYFEIDIPLITQDKTKQDILIDFFNNLNKKIKNDANTNAKIWFDENAKTYTMKTIVKDSDKYPHGLLKIKLIKTSTFETMLLLDNKKKISIKDIPQNSWIKMLLEIYSVVINTDNKSFYLFLRPIAISFKEKENIKYNYSFLEESSSSENDIPDSEVNNIFIKQNNVITNDKNDSTSQINVNNLNLLEIENNNKFSSDSSSESELKKINNIDTDTDTDTDTNTNTNIDNKKNILDTKDKLSDSSSDSDLKKLDSSSSSSSSSNS